MNCMSCRYSCDCKYFTACCCVYVTIRHGHCVRGLRCENGLRARHYYILSGSVLSVWTNVERAVASRMQIIRLRTDNGKKIVGKFTLHDYLYTRCAVQSRYCFEHCLFMCLCVFVHTLNDCSSEVNVIWQEYVL